jgi:hypothetical protein
MLIGGDPLIELIAPELVPVKISNRSSLAVCGNIGAPCPFAVQLQQVSASAIMTANRIPDRAIRPYLHNLLVDIPSLSFRKVIFELKRQKPAHSREPLRKCVNAQ